jgi:hypothetical protein
VVSSFHWNLCDLKPVGRGQLSYFVGVIVSDQEGSPKRCCNAKQLGVIDVGIAVKSPSGYCVGRINEEKSVGSRGIAPEDLETIAVLEKVPSVGFSRSFVSSSTIGLNTPC